MLKRKSEAGQTLALVSFGLLTFLAAAGLAVDMGYMRYEKRLMQRNEALNDNYYVLNEKVQKLQEQMTELEKRDNHVYRAIFEAAPIPDSARARADICTSPPPGASSAVNFPARKTL